VGGDSDLSGVDDAYLLGRLRRDPAALEEFYRRHVRAVAQFARRQVGAGADVHGRGAEDIVAATFLAVIEAADRYDAARGATRAWLFGIAGNLIATQYRRAAAESRATRRLGGRRADPPDEFGQLDEAIDAMRLTGPAAEVLAQLPTAERELVGLLLDRHTLPEAADVLGIRPATARMRLARARARLAPYLRQPDSHPGDVR
jgi:RNA polymerase sigma-70 factor (ECF subfamily)